MGKEKTNKKPDEHPTYAQLKRLKKEREKRIREGVNKLNDSKGLPEIKNDPAYVRKKVMDDISAALVGATQWRPEAGLHYYTSDEELKSYASEGMAEMPYTAFTKKTSSLPLRGEEWAAILDTTTRTLQRKKELNEKFSRLQSERILEIEALAKRGIQVFGNSEKYISWMSTPSSIFEGKAPKVFLGSGFGIDLLFDALGRIEHGIFA